MLLAVTQGSEVLGTMCLPVVAIASTHSTGQLKFKRRSEMRKNNKCTKCKAKDNLIVKLECEMHRIIEELEYKIHTLEQEIQEIYDYN